MSDGYSVLDKALLVLLPTRAKPELELWKVAVVADVAVEAVDLECFNRFRRRSCFLWTSTRTKVKQPARTLAALK